MIDLAPLLSHANLVIHDNTEENLEAFLQYINNLEQPDDDLESAILDTVMELTMHEYLCHSHEHIEQEEIE
jgi:hypothetical protein